MTASFFLLLAWHTRNSIEHRNTIGLKNNRRAERNCSFRRKKNAVGITKRSSALAPIHDSEWVGAVDGPSEKKKEKEKKHNLLR